jgi:hypothetical protein
MRHEREAGMLSIARGEPIAHGEYDGLLHEREQVLSIARISAPRAGLLIAQGGHDGS